MSTQSRSQISTMFTAEEDCPIRVSVVNASGAEFEFDGGVLMMTVDGRALETLADAANDAVRRWRVCEERMRQQDEDAEDLPDDEIGGHDSTPLAS